MPFMGPQLCWSRAGLLTASSTVSVYLAFDVPPLAAGSIIVVEGHGGLVTNAVDTGVIVLGVNDDWLGSTTTTILTQITSGGATSYAGMFRFQVAIQDRKSARTAGNLLDIGGSTVRGQTNALVSTVDWGRSQRLAVYCTNAAGGSNISAALVQVFCQRFYR